MKARMLVLAVLGLFVTAGFGCATGGKAHILQGDYSRGYRSKSPRAKRAGKQGRGHHFQVGGGVFLPTDKEFKDMYGSSQATPALGMTFDTSYDSFLKLQLEGMSKSGDPVINDPTIKSGELKLSQYALQTSLCYLPAPSFYLGGGIDITYASEKIEVVFVDDTVQSDSGSKTGLGCHVVLGGQLEIAKETSLYIECVYKFLGLDSKVSKADLGGFWLFVGVRF
jgi:hypothetical protein